MPARGRLTRRALLAGLISAAGCAQVRAPAKPPLRELYAEAGSAEQPPLIVIPGAFGSSLRRRSSGKEIWPGNNLDLLLGNYAHLALEIDPDTLEPVPDDAIAHDIFRDGLGQDFYGRVLRTLERAGGYRRQYPGKVAGKRSYYVYTYDWRLDNARSVSGLHSLIEQVRADYGQPDLRVDILAHSNGGLLARYYANYGNQPAADGQAPIPSTQGADTIRRLILVGTPNLGTIQPVLSHLRGEEIGLRKIPQEVMATCPGATQLLPHPHVTWLIDLRGNPVRRDLFDIATWREFGWSIFARPVRRRIMAESGGGAAGKRRFEILERYFDKQLRRGRWFIEALAAAPPEGGVAPQLFGGDCSPTLARLVLERSGGRMHARERPGDIAGPIAGVDYEKLMFEPGDLIVTRNSLLARCSPAPLDQCGAESALRPQHSVFLCAEHRALTGDPVFQDNLLYTLLSAPAA